MCTVTWLRQPDGYQLLCNRDERHSRQPALGPACNERKGVKYVAPIDGDHGGSWIGVNEFGVSLCLLNRYGDPELVLNSDYTSRGLLLLELLSCAHLVEVKAQVNDVDLRRFRPFNLLALSQSGESALLEWTGSQFSIINDVDRLVPLTSTSLSEPAIAIERRQQFLELTLTRGLNGDSLDAYHRTHLPERGAHSVCMHRAEAATVSFSKITVVQREILFEYESGSPCQRNEVIAVRLQ